MPSLDHIEISQEELLEFGMLLQDRMDADRRRLKRIASQFGRDALDAEINRRSMLMMSLTARLIEAQKFINESPKQDSRYVPQH